MHYQCLACLITWKIGRPVSLEEQHGKYFGTTVTSLLQNVDHIDEDFVAGYYCLPFVDQDRLRDALTPDQLERFFEEQKRSVR